MIDNEKAVLFRRFNCKVHCACVMWRMGAAMGWRRILRSQQNLSVCKHRGSFVGGFHRAFQLQNVSALQVDCSGNYDPFQKNPFGGLDGVQEVEREVHTENAPPMGQVGRGQSHQQRRSVRSARDQNSPSRAACNVRIVVERIRVPCGQCKCLDLLFIEGMEARKTASGLECGSQHVGGLSHGAQAR